MDKLRNSMHLLADLDGGGPWCKECINYLVTSGLILNDDNGFRLAPAGQTKMKLL